MSFSAVAEETVRLTIPAETIGRLPEQATVLHDYGSYRLLSMPASVYRAAAEDLTRRGARRMDSRSDWLMFDAQPIDAGAYDAAQGQRLAARAVGAQLHVVQFVGPVKQDWLDQLKAMGVEPVHYVATNGYLVWAPAGARTALAELAAAGAIVRYEAAYSPEMKLNPTLRAKLDKAIDLEQIVPVTVQMLDHPEGAATRTALAGLAVRQVTPWQPILRYQNARFDIALRDLQQVIERPDVYWVGEVLPRELLDEVQNQIMAGNFNGDQSGPSAPGYFAYLGGLGFPSTPASYPVVDIVDDIVDNGTTAVLDVTLYEEGSNANPTRVFANANCTSSSSSTGVGGHGHINASIAVGYDLRGGFPFVDPNNYQRGLGVNPFGRVAGTRIFSGGGFDISACGGTDSGLIKETEDHGADISSNSWGCSGCAGSYDNSSQAFDVGVRDADLSEPGNQELMHIFAAGNSGPGSETVGSPGNGKNMLTVGASENQRPSDEDGNWTDGCGIGPTGADDAMDVISFSSRGPSPGNRVKPETIAPGTHIQGTRQTNPAFTGSGTCDSARPSGQTDFAASSGTSHSTPAVAGLASLAWYWIENNPSISFVEATRGGTAPTPALLKAYLISHPTYLTGVGGSDDFPSNTQGYGMPNMNLMFDDTLKAVVNQEVVFDNSGESWEFVGSAADPAKPVRIMLVYTDAPGALGTSPQVNDLNLTVETGGDTYLGNNFSGEFSVTGGAVDAANNYEAVFFPAGAATDLTITVDAFNIAGDGIPNSGDGTDQDFALVCYNCAQEPTFTLAATPGEQAICTPDDALYQIDVGSVLGFTDPVTLGISGVPAGATSGFSMNPVTPPGMSTLTIGNTGAAAFGSYEMTIDGTAGLETKMRSVDLSIFTAVAGAPTLTVPADGAPNIVQQPVLEWTAGTQAADYTVEIATDDAFTNIVYSATVSGTTTTVGTPLDSNQTYYWRVSAANECGGATSATFSFTTVALPGDCAAGTLVQKFFDDDLEGDTSGWSHSGNGDTWELQGNNTISGSNAWHAEDVSSVSDQYLVTPPINLPGGGGATTFQFWTDQILEDGGAGCYDGGFLEISTDGGNNWTPLENGRMLTDPYDGPLDSGFSNPAAGTDAWCGDPQPWLESIVDVESFAGETVQFRFRLATDSSVGREGWYIDDVSAQRCVVDLIFRTGVDP